MNNTVEPQDWVEIPYQNISDDALTKIVQDFILQEGTDYGSQEYSIEEKVTHVMNQLRSGKARIVFSEELHACNVVVGRRN